MSLKICESNTDLPTLKAYCELLAECFPAARRMDMSYLHWLYEDSPRGRVVGFDAWDGDRLAAHYACVPMPFLSGGTVVNAMLSLNTATRPDYQGRGLFKELATLSYARAASLGIKAVLGVANAQSTPGFVQRLQFQLVAPLEARIGWEWPRIDPEQFHQALRWAPLWDEAAFQWRYRNPRRPLLTPPRTEGYWCQAAAGSIFNVIAPLPASLSDFKPLRLLPGPSLAEDAPSKPGWPLHLFLGLLPRGSWRWPVSMNLPVFARPSPLNLIYRALTPDMPPKIAAEGVSFSFLDFDAY